MSPEIVAKIQSILGWPATHEQIRQAKHLVPDELVVRITASGTPGRGARQGAGVHRPRCTCPILYPVGSDVKLLVDTFSPLD